MKEHINGTFSHFSSFKNLSVWNIEDFYNWIESPVDWFDLKMMGIFLPPSFYKLENWKMEYHPNPHPNSNPHETLKILFFRIWLAPSSQLLHQKILLKTGDHPFPFFGRVGNWVGSDGTRFERSKEKNTCLVWVSNPRLSNTSLSFYHYTNAPLLESQRETWPC